jgi:hypothetical protein
MRDACAYTCHQLNPPADWQSAIDILRETVAPFHHMAFQKPWIGKAQLIKLVFIYTAWQVGRYF